MRAKIVAPADIAQRHLHRRAHRAVERRAGNFAAVPRKPDHGLTRLIKIRLRRIGRRRVGELADRLNRLVQALFVKFADIIHVVRAGINPQRAAVVRRQRIEVRAFVVTRQVKALQQRPVQKVLRDKDAVIAPLKIQRHQPPAALGVEDDLRVAVAAGKLRQQRVAAVFDERFAAVGAVGQTLRAPLARAGVEEQKRRLAPPLEAGAVLAVHNGRTGKHGALHVAEQRLFPVRPMEQIRADRMAPVHIAPKAPVRVVLVEKVVSAVIKAQAVRVVDPPTLRREVHRGAQRVLRRCERGRRIAEHGDKVLRRIERYGPPRIIAQVGIVFRIWCIRRIRRVERIDRRPVFRKREPPVLPGKFHGNFQIPLFNVQLHFHSSFPFWILLPVL